MAKYVLSRHAEDQLVIRDILPADLETVHYDPEQTLHQSDNSVVLQSRIEQNGVRFLLRVVVSYRDGVPLVLTAYKTTKIDRYWKS